MSFEVRNAVLHKTMHDFLDNNVELLISIKELEQKYNELIGVCSLEQAANQELRGQLDQFKNIDDRIKAFEAEKEKYDKKIEQIEGYKKVIGEFKKENKAFKEKIDLIENGKH